MRAGELCGLRVDDIEMRGLVNVRQSAWHGKLQEPKTVNAIRTFAVSSRLLNHLWKILSTWRPNPYEHLHAYGKLRDDERIAEQLGEILDAVGQNTIETTKGKGPAFQQALVN